MEKRLPQPISYCPINDSNRLSKEAMEALDEYKEQFALITVIKRCLCNSCGYAEIKCDPDICSPKIKKAITYAKSTDHVLPALGGASKKIYREYVQNKNKKVEISTEWSNILDNLLDEE